MNPWGYLAAECADAAVALIVEGGPRAMTMSAVARRIGCSPQAVHQAFGGWDGFIAALVERLADRWKHWLGFCPVDVLARMPVDDDEVAALVGWLGIVDLASAEARRGHASLTEALAAIRDWERDEIYRRLKINVSPDIDGHAVAAGTALVRGLWVDIARGHLPASDAQQQAQRWMVGLRVD